MYRMIAAAGSIAALFIFLYQSSAPGSAQVYPHAAFILFLAFLAFGHLDAGIEELLSFAFAGVTAYNLALLDWMWGASDLGAFFSAISWVVYTVALLLAGLIADQKRAPSA